MSSHTHSRGVKSSHSHISVSLQTTFTENLLNGTVYLTDYNGKEHYFLSKVLVSGIKKYKIWWRKHIRILMDEVLLLILCPAAGFLSSCTVLSQQETWLDCRRMKLWWMKLNCYKSCRMTSGIPSEEKCSLMQHSTVILALSRRPVVHTDVTSTVSDAGFSTLSYGFST